MKHPLFRALLGALCALCGSIPFATPARAQVEASDAQATAGTAGWPYVMTPRRVKTVTDGLTLDPIDWQGAWSSLTTYSVGQGVDDAGSSYVCILESTNNQPPNATYWQLVASIGDTGAQGDAGDTGSAGADGAGYGGTATDTLTPALGTISITTQTGLAYLTGSRVRLADAGSPDDNWAEGVVTTYTTGTGALEFEADRISASAAEASSWTVSVVGEPGIPGLYYNHGNGGTTEVVDVQQAQWHRVVADQSDLEITFSNWRASGRKNPFQLDVVQPAGGGSTLSFNTGSTPNSTPDFVNGVAAGTITLNSGANEITSIFIDSPDGGTTIYAYTTTVESTPADGSVTISKVAAAALVIESEGISSNDNNTTFPTSAAVKDYADTADAAKANLSGGNTFSGAQTLAEGGSVTLDAAGSADGAWTGIARAGTAGATLAFGDLIVLDVTDSRWELADANSAAAADGDARGLIGICVLAAASDGDPTTVLFHGIVRADTAFPTMTVTAPVFISETAGDVTSTSPTTEDNVVRVVGWATTADELYFAPSPSFITYDAP